MALARRAPRLGLALGSGSARGWAHIGVLQVLDEEGIRPDIVCGSSIGALVGAAYAAGELQRFTEWVQGLGMRDVFGFMDFNITGGMLKGEKLIAFWRRNFADFDIDRSPMPFGAVATDLHSGAEVWLRHGSIADAVRASIALPGLFTPVMRDDGRLLVDGGLVNPVPVSLCRAMGADVVIAVDLNWDIMLRHSRVASHAQAPEIEAEASAQGGLMQAIVSRLRPAKAGNGRDNGPPMPSMLDVLTTSLNIMQMRITQSRLAGEPADVVIRPRLNDVAAMDYHLAASTIAEGERAAEYALPHLRDVLA